MLGIPGAWGPRECLEFCTVASKLLLALVQHSKEDKNVKQFTFAWARGVWKGASSQPALAVGQGSLSVEEALVPFPSSLLSLFTSLHFFPSSLTKKQGVFFSVNSGHRCESFGNIKNSTNTIFFHCFIHLCLEYFQAEFEASHKIEMVQVSPQPIQYYHRTAREREVIKGMGTRKIISKNQTEKSFFY